MKLNAIPEDDMKDKYPKTYLYLKKFESELRERSGYKRYFTKKDKTHKVVETGPFYSMFNIGDYTFSPFKVVWREQAASLMAAVIESQDSKIIIPDHKLMFVDCHNDAEAHYVCALLNSRVAQFTVASYAIGIQMDTHILKYIKIPKFDPKNSTHKDLKDLSIKAHRAAAANKKDDVLALEEQIDELATRIWGLTHEEVKEVKLSLQELA